MIERIRARSEELEEAVASRREESSVGPAFFNTALDRVWDLNYLRAERGDAFDIAAEADRLQGGAGLGHRAAYVPDGSRGARLVAGFARLGWSAEETVVMLHGSEPGAPPPPAGVEEVSLDAVAGLYRRYRERQAFGADFHTLDQLAARDALMAEHSQARFFAVHAGSEAVAFCTLYRLGDLGQVEDVVTDRDHRRQGYARAVVARAVAESYAAGAAGVFLEADAHDWPKKLYSKLGFKTVGRSWEFVKRPPVSSSSA